MLIIVKQDKVNKIFGYICRQIEIAVTCKVTAVFFYLKSLIIGLLQVIDY